MPLTFPPPDWLVRRRFSRYGGRGLSSPSRITNRAELAPANRWKRWRVQLPAVETDNTLLHHDDVLFALVFPEVYKPTYCVLFCNETLWEE